MEQETRPPEEQSWGAQYAEAQTLYDQKTYRAMTRAMGKTLRRRSRRRTHLSGWAVALAGALLVLSQTRAGRLDLWGWACIAAVGIVLLTLLGEEHFTAALGVWLRRPGTKTGRIRLWEGGYSVETEGAYTRFSYAQIQAVVETAEYFVLVLSPYNAQALDKGRLEGCSVETLRRVLREKTGREIVKG